MQLPSKQRGLGWFGLLIMFGALGFVFIVVMKCWPLYLNEMKLARAVKRVAADSEISASEAPQEKVRNALQKWWRVEDIEFIDPTEIKVKNTDKGRTLSYDYWAQTNLYANCFVSFHFVKEEPFQRPGG